RFSELGAADCAMRPRRCRNRAGDGRGPACPGAEPSRTDRRAHGAAARSVATEAIIAEQTSATREEKMINRTEIGRGIHRISFWDEADWAPISFPGASYNLFLIAATKPAIVQTLFRRTFGRIRKVVDEVSDARALEYIVVPHHEGDSSGAVNEWLHA